MEFEQNTWYPRNDTAIPLIETYHSNKNDIPVSGATDLPCQFWIKRKNEADFCIQQREGFVSFYAQPNTNLIYCQLISKKGYTEVYRFRVDSQLRYVKQLGKFLVEIGRTESMNLTAKTVCRVHLQMETKSGFNTLIRWLDNGTAV